MTTRLLDPPDTLEVVSSRSAPRLRVDCREFDFDAVLPHDVLAAITFGKAERHPRDPRCIRVPLSPLVGHGLAQVWTGNAPVRLGQTGLVRHVADGTHLMGWLEIDEGAAGGLAAAAEAAYDGLLAFHATSRYRHVWRMWNFVDDINGGAGDDERYKLFSLGRARAYARAEARAPGIGYPAATAVGTDGGRRLLICWLAGIEPGHAIENPRQVSAYRYPREYGPAAPNFSRAMVTPEGALLVSGTASIVGHGSLHAGDVDAQLEETLRNLDAVTAAAAAVPGRTRAPAPALLTVFLREPAAAARVASRLREHYSNGCGIVVLDSAICRSELLLEIEAID